MATGTDPDAGNFWASFGWLSDRPPILYHSMDEHDFNACLPPEPVYRLCTLVWHYPIETLVRYFQRDRAARPDDVQVVLPNDADDHLQLRQHGVPSVFAHQNALLDESVFRVMPDVPKVYDAVYVARMHPDKRHLLAQQVTRSLMIGGVTAQQADADYFATVRRSLPQAHFTHAEHSPLFRPAAVARWLNRARVGLCLSALEGAMYGSVEYLLCGLPVVSTYNQGGRDEFLDPGYCRLVPDDPQAIADAVHELIALHLPPQWVRDQTLRRMAEHRGRFVDLVQSFYDREQLGRCYADDFQRTFYNKLCAWRRAGDVLQCRAADCAPKPHTPTALWANRLKPGSPHSAALSAPTLDVGGPAPADLWRSLHIALDAGQDGSQHVRFNALWTGSGQSAQTVDHSDLARSLLAALDGVNRLDIVSEPAAAPGIDWSNYGHQRLPPARPPFRWLPWRQGLRRRIVVAGSTFAAPDLRSRLRAVLPGYQLIPLEEQQPAACLPLLAASDLFVGDASPSLVLALAVGVPVFLLGHAVNAESPLLGGGRLTVACTDEADVLRKIRWFFGLIG